MQTDFIGDRDFDKDPDVKKFIIVGCGRSGTMYMSKVFEILGYKVGHEGFKNNGTSSWYIVERRHAQRVKELMSGHNATYIHIVRNPMDVISSMNRCEMLKNRLALDFVRYTYEGFEGYGITAIAKWWVLWNMEAVNNFAIDFTLPIEQLEYPDAVKKLCDISGVEYTPQIFQNIKKLGKKTHELLGREKNSLIKQYGEDVMNDITFNDLAIENAKIAELLNIFSQKYGYRISL